MKCPVCRKQTLRKCLLEEDLPAYECKKCGGIWIPAIKYWKWLKKRDNASLETPIDEGSLPLPVEEATPAKLCPECGRFLRRYKVWPNIEFYLDRCAHCRSVWFDKDEWAVLRSRNLHKQIHLFFTDIWQDGLRTEESRERFEKMYRERFGEEDYAKLKEIRAWLNQHPQRGAFWAYLSDSDPYRTTSETSEVYRITLNP